MVLNSLIVTLLELIIGLPNIFYYQRVAELVLLKLEEELLVFTKHVGSVSLNKIGKKVPHYLNFSCSAHHSQSPNKLGETFKLQTEIIKQEFEHEEIFEILV